MRERNGLRWLRRRLREGVRDKTWLLPLVGGVLGFVLAQLVPTQGSENEADWTVTVDRARDTLFGMLALMFTALSVVLALASVAATNVVGRFGSRTLRVYLRRSVEKFVVGSFALASTFILVEQFQLRKLDPEATAPVGGITISILLLVLSATLMIAYIGTVVRWFRVDKAVIVMRKATLESVAAVVRASRSGDVVAEMPVRPASALDLRAPRSGHLAEIDADTLLELCRPLEAMAVITEPLGAAVVKDQPIGWIATRGSKAMEVPEADIAETIDVSGTRELEYSIEYDMVSLVDIAIIALSPAVNDPNTAVEVIEEMEFFFRRASEERLGPYAVPDADAWPRVVVWSRPFGVLIDLATTQIVLYGVSDPMVLRALHRLADSLQRLDLNDDDRRHVDQFAEKLADDPAGQPPGASNDAEQ